MVDQMVFRSWRLWRGQCLFGICPIVFAAQAPHGASFRTPSLSPSAGSGGPGGDAGHVVLDAFNQHIAQEHHLVLFVQLRLAALATLT